MEAICSSEKLVDFQRNTLRYIPENSAVEIKICLQKFQRTVGFLFLEKYLKLSLSLTSTTQIH
jgi:hypothetical protein